MVVLVALVNNLSALYRTSRSANEALANLAKLDGLTGARHRRGFDDSLAANARRPGDTVSRYGGEEFAVLLPRTDIGGALLVANRILSSLAELALPHADASSGFVSLSVGVACSDGKDSAALVGEADGFLYAAKPAGRGCVRHPDLWLPSNPWRLPRKNSRPERSVGAAWPVSKQPLHGFEGDDLRPATARAAPD